MDSQKGAKRCNYKCGDGAHQDDQDSRAVPEIPTRHSQTCTDDGLHNYLPQLWGERLNRGRLEAPPPPRTRNLTAGRQKRRLAGKVSCAGTSAERKPFIPRTSRRIQKLIAAQSLDSHCPTPTESIESSMAPCSRFSVRVARAGRLVRLSLIAVLHISQYQLIHAVEITGGKIIQQ